MRGSISELLVVAIVAMVFVLFFGARKIPELAQSLKEGRDVLKSDDEKNEDVVEVIDAKEATADAVKETADVAAEA